ncbi:geranyl diphosphate synthase-like [Anthonomus grandis grandis]|uniref:geranyl diphosphate synthase-like n=1 Tax=Anthonomus grandis grandis TaxID=2921223 RepID=UPI002165A14B|nr:geranyl diphosphate synthase-like [Anthonomus grandis grandis]
MFCSKLPTVNQVRLISEHCIRNRLTLTSLLSGNQRNFFGSSHEIENKVYENKEKLIANFSLIEKCVKETFDYEILAETYDEVLGSMNYISTGGKMWRPCSLICTYKLLEKPENITEENLKLAYIYAWCTEIIHGLGALIDNIQRTALMRRNKKSFIFLPEITENVMSYAQTIDFLANDIIIRYFGAHPSQEILLDNIARGKFRCYSGLVYEPLFVDYSTKRAFFSTFTMENYLKVIKYKYGYYGIRVPIEGGMALANQHDPQKIENSATVLDQLGVAYNMKDDFNDLLVNTTQKEITDDMDNYITQSKFTWFAVKTLELGNADQKRVWQQHYGIKKQESILKVLSVYQELRLEQLFQEEKDRQIKFLKEEIPKIRNGVPENVLYSLAEGLLEVKLRN